MFLQCRGCDLLSNLSSDHFFHSIRMATPMNAFYFWVASSDDVMNCHLHKADKWRLPWMCLRFTCFEEHCCKNVAAALAKVGPNRPKLANAGLGQPLLAKIGPGRPQLVNAGFGQPRLAEVAPFENRNGAQVRATLVFSFFLFFSFFVFVLHLSGVGAQVRATLVFSDFFVFSCCIFWRRRAISCNFGVFIFFIFFRGASFGPRKRVLHQTCPRSAPRLTNGRLGGPRLANAGQSWPWLV